MKIKLININYNDNYKSIAVYNRPSELTIDIPDITTENNMHIEVCKAIAKQYSFDLAMGIESAEFIKEND